MRKVSLLSRLAGAMAALMLAAIIQSSCSALRARTERGDPLPNPQGTVHLQRLVFQTLHFRRPAGAGADPAASAGGEDYFSRPLPDARWDCRPLPELLTDLRFEALRACFARVNESLGKWPLGEGVCEIRYSLHRDARPELVLEFDGIPSEVREEFSCLRELIGRIPVPREIFFQSREEESVDYLRAVPARGAGESSREFYQPAPRCYSSRLGIEKDVVAGVRVPFLNVWTMRVLLPIEVPRNDEDTYRLLASWILSPFFDAEKNSISAKIVPDRLCGQCIGEKSLVRPGDPPSLLWP